MVRLLATAPVTALIDDRIYPASAPQGAVYPFVTYQRISTPRFRAMGQDATVAQTRIQVNIYARTENNTAYALSKQVAAAVRAALSRWRGTFASTVIQDCYIDNEQDLEAPDTQVHGVALDILISYGEP